MQERKKERKKKDWKKETEKEKRLKETRSLFYNPLLYKEPIETVFFLVILWGAIWGDESEGREILPLPKFLKSSTQFKVLFYFRVFVKEWTFALASQNY